MDRITAHITDTLEFHDLQGFTRFILEYHLEDFIAEQIRISKEVELRAIADLGDLPYEDLVKLSRKPAAEFLTMLSENRAADLVSATVKSWINTNRSSARQEHVSGDDIPLISYIRKNTFLKFLPLYTSQQDEALRLIREIDLYILQSELALNKTYVDLLQTRIKEQNHFKQLLTATSPGIIYVFDLNRKRFVFSNDKSEQILGYTFRQVQQMGDNMLSELLHPDDLPQVLQNISKNLKKRRSLIWKLEYRVKHANGRYKWLRIYESVFKRNEIGIPTQTIGFVLDIDKEKIAEQELKKREEQLLEAEKLANMGSFEWNFTDPAKCRYSPQLMELFELTAPSTLDKYMEKVSPADRQKVRDALEKAIKETGIYECEYRYIRQGREYVLESKGLVTYEDGKPCGLKGTVIDITDKHRTLERLRENKEFYKQAQAITHMGNWIWDHRNDNLSWTDELYRIHGLAPQSEEINFKKFLGFVHEEDKTLFKDIFKSLKNKPEPTEFYHRIVLKDGTVKMLHDRLNTILDENNELSKVLGTCQDVTLEHEKEKELRDKTSFIQKIADAAPSIIASYNINTGKYIFINQAVEKLLGYKPEQVLEEGIAFFLRIVHPDDLPLIQEQNAKALEEANRQKPDTEPILEFKYRMLASDGRYRWFHTYGTIFDRNSQGQVEHVLNISVDITDIMEAEDILSRQNLELQQSNSNLEEFAYIASHDLKEPLRKISSFGDRLLTTQVEKLDDQGRLYLEKIIDSSQRMQTMISDLLSVSLITGNKAFEMYSLKSILDEVLKTLEYKIEKKNAVIKSTNLPEAYIVPSQFRQLFQNLLSNSLKFSKPGVTPEIQVRHHFLSAREVEAAKLGKQRKYLQVSFSDNGIGFDSQYSEQIFAIFNRLHGRSEYEGTGIGLAICKKIISHHQGIIYAVGEEGKGSTFTFIIPTEAPKD